MPSYRGRLAPLGGADNDVVGFYSLRSSSDIGLAVATNVTYSSAGALIASGGSLVWDNGNSDPVVQNLTALDRGFTVSFEAHKDYFPYLTSESMNIAQWNDTGGNGPYYLRLVGDDAADATKMFYRGTIRTDSTDQDPVQLATLWKDDDYVRFDLSVRNGAIDLYVDHAHVGQFENTSRNLSGVLDYFAVTFEGLVRNLQILARPSFIAVDPLYNRVVVFGSQLMQTHNYEPDSTVPFDGSAGAFGNGVSETRRDFGVAYQIHRFMAKTGRYCVPYLKAANTGAPFLMDDAGMQAWLNGTQAFNPLDYNPQQLVFYGGEHDIQSQASYPDSDIFNAGQEFETDLQSFIDQFRAVAPECRIHLCTLISPYPRGIADPETYQLEDDMLRCDRANARIWELANRNPNCNVIDLFSAFGGHDPAIIMNYYEPDDLLPRRDGHVLVGKTIGEQLVANLR